MAVVELDRIDRLLTNRIQEDFPLERRPFRALGEGLGISEGEALARVASLKRRHIVRQISAIFDTRTLGYSSMLAAARVPPERLDEVAGIINDHPGVSHNYRRNHDFNLWFTIAVPPGSDILRTIDKLRELTGIEAIRPLPTIRLFKIGVQLDLTGQTDMAAKVAPTNGRRGYSDDDRRRAAALAPIGERDKAFIRELQEDFELTPEPYAPMARRLGVSQDELFAWAHDFQSQGRLRRVAAVLHHREAGFRANAMGVWKVPPERLEEVGQRFAAFRAVSHAYQRPTYPDWPYNVFTMVHGRTPDDCQKAIDAMSAEAGIDEYALLYSGKEYKKVRVRYFTPEMEEWEAKHGLASARA